VRLDHPHGLVCPWVYREGDEPARGARLHESPDLPDLAPFARVRLEQLARERPRHDDDWVRWLDPDQIVSYAAVLDALVDRARAAAWPGRTSWPRCSRPARAPWRRSSSATASGRFRVTQKARVDDAADVYRADSALPPTGSWRATTTPCRWRSPSSAGRALPRSPAGRLPHSRLHLDADAALRLERDPRALADAMLAELFLGPARHVLIFWVDLFEGRAEFNRPGIIHPDNWTARVPPDFERAYAGALDRAVALALRARE
jgi:hypothetical protein